MLLLLVMVRSFMIIPPTGGTGINTSGAAAAPQCADHENECNADKNVDKLIVTHGYFTLVGEMFS
jgi:hypothetical protein